MGGGRQLVSDAISFARLQWNAIVDSPIYNSQLHTTVLLSCDFRISLFCSDEPSNKLVSLNGGQVAGYRLMFAPRRADKQFSTILAKRRTISGLANYRSTY